MPSKEEDVFRIFFFSICVISSGLVVGRAPKLIFALVLEMSDAGPFPNHSFFVITDKKVTVFF